MTTIRMKKGNKFADICDSPETIKQAQLDGYSIVESKKVEPAKEETKKEEPAEETKAARYVKK